MNEKPTSQQDNKLSKIEQQVIAQYPEAVKNVPHSKLRQIIQSVVTIKSHSGPLPDPETLEKYSEIIPNGAERIMAVFEKQSDHRIKMERKVIRGQLNQSNIGQCLAFLICMGFLACATFLIYENHDNAGAVLGIGSLTGLVTVFIKGKSYQRKELEQKRPNQ